jgi:uncharacterized protein (DUF58 family)
MARETRLSTPLEALNDAELEALARVAERLFAGRALSDPGTRVAQRRAGAGLEFFDFREYTPGDDPRTIDWRATARARRTLVRRHHEEAAADWLVCVDRSASMATAGGDKWRLAVQLAAALAYVLLALNNRVGLLLFSERVDAVCRLGRGQRHYAAVLETLAAHAPVQRGGGSDLTACAPVLKRGQSCVVLSDFLTPDGMRTGLARVASIAGVLHALQVSSLRDHAVGHGAVTLVDAENGQELTLVDGERRSAAVLDRVAEHGAALAATCRESAVKLTNAACERGWKDNLLAHFASFGGGRA